MLKLKPEHSHEDSDAVADCNVRDWYLGVLKSEPNTVVPFATQLQLNELRVGVLFEEVEPFSFDYLGITIEVDKHGNLTEWPDGMFDQCVEQMKELISGKRSR